MSLHNQSTAQMKILHHTTIFTSYIIIFILLLLPAASSSSQAIISSDRITLLTIKSMISDPSDALSSWAHNTTLHFCRWRGVTCGRRHPDRVTSLKLDSFNLTGSLPPHIANLTFLHILHLQSNSFRGSIPYELGLRLSGLSNLNLSHNYLDGEIPATLMRCSTLQFISLQYNQLSGEIPRDIGSLSQLKVLSLCWNHLTGTIPRSLGNLSSSSFIQLYLHVNDLVGGIPESLGKLSSLEDLNLGDNNLSGNIPSSIYNLSSLTDLWLYDNSLTGTLASNLFDTLPNLRYLVLFENPLEGHIPSSISNATSLHTLEMVKNNLIGTIPSNLGNLHHLHGLLLSDNQLEAKEASDWDFLTSLANCSNLQKLTLQANHLGGILPSSVANLSKLQLFAIQDNQISGSLPDGIGNLANLSILNLRNNLLLGCIPPTLGKLQQLHKIDLSGNQLMGHIPHTTGNLTQLIYLYLQGNSLNGSIPASLGKCQSLEILDLSQNIFTGSIPKEIVMLSSLSIYLDLSHNLLTGLLPSELDQLRQLRMLNISHNKLSGEIPASLGDCQSLELLYMELNFFDGVIPQSFSELKGLKELNLAQNNLSGKFPVYFGRLGGLQYLNLSYNDLDGVVPNEGIFRNNVSQVSVLGNKNLCGGSPSLHLPVCSSLTLVKKQHHISLLLKVIISVVGACLCMILFIVIFFARHRLKNKQKKSPVTSSIKGQFPRISYGDLLNATDGFSPSNLIGAGSVGTVYKGFLNSDENISMAVAVKVLNLQRRGASKSFLAECEVLRNIRHRNLVKILTSCSSVDFNGNDFKALVLEFLPNGSLEKWLHPIVTSHENSELMPLSLDERLNIAIDVASALDYLHNHGQAPIVHCDLKPSNILLDADMCAHVGDFGLAKFLWEKIPGVDEKKTTSSGIKGTIGYVAPEYGMGNQASTYGDVYSFGVLMLELFTGKQPTDKIFTNVQGLPKYIELVFPERVMDIVDPRLHLSNNGQEAQDNNKIGVKEYSCLVSVIGIGLSCTKKDPRERMKMEAITRELHALKDVLHKFETYV